MQRTLLGLNFKKILGRIFFKNVVPKESFFVASDVVPTINFVASDVVPTINFVYVLEINIFGEDESIQIWIISSKDINIQYLCKIYCRELEQYRMNCDGLE